MNKNDNSFDSLNLLSSIYIPGTALSIIQASFHLLPCPWEGAASWHGEHRGSGYVWGGGY